MSNNYGSKIDLIALKFLLVRARLYFEFRACEYSALRQRESLLTPKVPCVTRLLLLRERRSSLPTPRPSGRDIFDKTHTHIPTLKLMLCKRINDKRSVINKENPS